MVFPKVKKVCEIAVDEMNTVKAVALIIIDSACCDDENLKKSALKKLETLAQIEVTVNMFLEVPSITGR